MISRVKQQLRGSDLHNSAANTPRGRLTFAASKLGLPSANPRPHRLTSRFAPPRNGPGSLLFPSALKVIPRRLPPHDLSLRYHPTPLPSNGANDAVEGWQVSPPGRRINQSPPSTNFFQTFPRNRFESVCSVPLFTARRFVVHLRKKGEITTIIADINSRPIPSILRYIIYIKRVRHSR